MSIDNLDDFLWQGSKNIKGERASTLRFAIMGKQLEEIKDMREHPEKGDYKSWAHFQFLSNFFTIDMEQEVWAAIYRLISKHRNVFNACIKQIGFSKNGYGCTERIWDTAGKILYMAALGGSRTAKDVMTSLYKEHYSDEYLQLKKCDGFSYRTLIFVKDRIGDLEAKENFMICCRMICMSELMGIPIDEEYADRVYAMAKYASDEIPSCHMDKEEKFTVSGLPDRRELAAGKDFMDDLFVNDSIRDNLLNKDFNFIVQACNTCGYRDRAIVVAGDCEPDKLMSYTGALLKRVFPNKTSYSKSEAALYYSIVYLVRSIADQNNAGYTVIKEILRQIDLADDTPDEAEVFINPSSAEMPATATDQPTPIDDAAAQIEELKKTIALMETEVAEYREQALSEKKRADKLEQELEDLRDDTADAAALRSFVYNMTEKEHPQAGNIGADKQKIKDLKVIVVGGHPNWVKKVKQEFPNWRFVVRKMSATADTDTLSHIDYLLFNTDSLGHKDYYKWINEARRLGVKIGYLSGMNLQNTIRQACDVLG